MRGFCLRLGIKGSPCQHSHLTFVFWLASQVILDKWDTAWRPKFLQFLGEAHPSGAAVVRLGPTPPAAWQPWWGPGRSGRRLGGRGLARHGPGYPAHGVGVSGAAPRAHWLCGVQGPGLAAGGVPVVLEQ